MNTIETLDQKFHTLTDKYKVVSTKDLVSRIEGLGFTVDRFVANKVRSAEKRGFQKHRVIFNSPLLKATEDGVPQLLLTNSHDGTSAVILQLGFFRLVCSNGLVIGKSISTPIAIRHTGKDMEERLVAAVNDIVRQASELSEHIEKMKSTVLTVKQMTEFQTKALRLRVDEDAVVESFAFPIYRQDDTPMDVFTVMNVIQESLIRGGASVTVLKDNQLKTRRLRKVKSISTQTKINTELWDMAQQLAA
jgi:hypothetical protein